ncbi:MAG: hypothetical protein K2O65_13885 [Lachnospiraceae bacterium]|nr:hypothetical protein [Lachnospiraceae bacterium]
MKKQMIAKLSLIGCLVIGALMFPGSKMTVHADEIMATVQGKVMAGTTTDLLKLSTKEGNMEIKLDGGTDASSV